MVTSGKFGSGAAAVWLGLCPLHWGFGISQVPQGDVGKIPVMPRQWAELSLFFSAILGNCKGIIKLYSSVIECRKKSLWSSFHCPVDRQPFMAFKKSGSEGKKKESVWLRAVWAQAGLDGGGTGLAERGLPRKGPNCAAFYQCTHRFCPGCIREVSVAGIIMGAIISVINMMPTVGMEAVSSPIHGLLCFEFSFCHRPQEAPQLSTEL